MLKTNENLHKTALTDNNIIRNNYNLTEDFWKLKTIGDRLHYLRENTKVKIRPPKSNIREHLTLTQMSEEIHIPRRTLSNYENGIQKIPDYDIQEICKYFDISCETLLNGKKLEHWEAQKKTNLTQLSINTLTSIQDTDMLVVLNNLISDKETFMKFMEAIYIFARLDIPNTVEFQDGTKNGRLSMYLVSEETLLKNIVSEYMLDLLSKIRKKHANYRRKQTDILMRELIEKFKSTLNKD